MPWRFLPPDGKPAVVVTHPRTGRTAHPHGAAPSAELWTAIEEEAEPALARLAGDVALDLTIGVPEPESLTQGRHLDNYLLTVASLLGQQRRIPAVFGRKVHGAVSALRVGPARYRADDVSHAMEVRVSGPPDEPAWRERVRDACATAVGDREPGMETVLLDLAFAVSSLRNWTTLWKPTIDALGPLLGTRSPDQPWAARDDRIVRLGLHRITSNSLARDVVVRAWWRTAEA